MRIIVIGTAPYRDEIANAFNTILGMQVVTNVSDATNLIHVINFQDEATEENRVALDADVTIWVNMDGTSDDDPLEWDIRLQDRLSDKHLNKLVNGIRERYIDV